MCIDDLKQFVWCVSPFIVWADGTNQNQKVLRISKCCKLHAICLVFISACWSHIIPFKKKQFRFLWYKNNKNFNFLTTKHVRFCKHFGSQRLNIFDQLLCFWSCEILNYLNLTLELTVFFCFEYIVASLFCVWVITVIPFFQVARVVCTVAEYRWLFSVRKHIQITRLVKS